MTTSLDSYLHGPYKEDGAFLSTLTGTIDEVLPMFYDHSSELEVRDSGIKVTSWPYVITFENEKLSVHENKFSASTHCMILFALDALDPRPKNRYSLLLSKDFRPHKLSTERQEGLRKILTLAKKSLVDVVKHSTGHLFKSGTYGIDDPFTLTWSNEIAFRWVSQADVTDDELRLFKDRLLKTTEGALKRLDILKMDTSAQFNEILGSFLKVRRLHLSRAGERLAKDLGTTISIDTKNIWKDFDDTIHRQLSYSSKGDQKFDPAELAFAFEGALLIHPNWISDSTVDQIFEALRLSKNRHPFWRPLRPFLANDQGHLLFLISIEVANSILRACETLVQEKGDLARFSQIEPQLRTFAMWLLEEVEEIPEFEKPNLIGWHTEYEDKRDKIQLWHTSHVLVFLTHYASLLKRKIAEEGIDAAGLQVTMPTNIKLITGFWDQEPLKELPAYGVIKKIKTQYIEPLEATGAHHNAAKSMILYGPPGTGKTTVAEQMAARLKRPLLVVTVSDFLAAGGAEIENRAKGVFEVLQSQEDIVILFDEIDQFLLDRNSSSYKEQSDIFKFMTPGMLTKLQNLRDMERCIFIIATNYGERIDSAIKRRGRVDEQFLLCLPDQGRRRNLVTRFLKKAIETDCDAQNKAAPADLEKTLNESIEAMGIPASTVLWGFGDLKNLVESNTRAHPLPPLSSIVQTLIDGVQEVESDIRLKSYKSRFAGDGEYPFEEFFLLLFQLTESRTELSRQDEEVIDHVLALIPHFTADLCVGLLKEQGIKDSKLICDRLSPYFKAGIERQGLKE
jgi:hypothetical protein